MLLNSHISAYARCLAGKVCSLVQSTWGTSPGEDKFGARDRILNTKVARRAPAGQTFPLSELSSSGHKSHIQIAKAIGKKPRKPTQKASKASPQQ